MELEQFMDNERLAKDQIAKDITNQINLGVDNKVDMKLVSYDRITSQF